MREIRASNLSDSAFDMQRLVWPAIAPWCGGGEYCPVESKADDSLAQDLDILAGIDGFQKFPQKGVMRGIASRVQWMEGKWEGHPPWNTFSIRKSRSTRTDTELKKRTYQLTHRNSGYLYPHITVQAYITKRRTGDLLSVAIAHTHELIPWASETFAAIRGIFAPRSYHNGTGVWEKEAYDTDGSWATFLAVDWDVYQTTGLALKRLSCEDSVVPVKLTPIINSFPTKGRSNA